MEKNMITKYKYKSNATLSIYHFGDIVYETEEEI